MNTTTRQTVGATGTFHAAFENSGVQINHIPGAPLTISRHAYTGRTCRVIEVREDQFFWADECSFPYRIEFSDGARFLIHRSEFAG